jgi:hypothetical protein
MMHKILALSFSVILPLAGINTSLAQQIETLRSKLQMEREELKSLERILLALNNGDTVYASYFPVWTVLDQNTKLSIYTAFRNRGKQFSEDERVTVIAQPNGKGIADIRIGNTSYGKLYASKSLDPELQRHVLRREYVLVDEIPFGYRNTLSKRTLAEKPSWIAANVSLFGGSMRFGNDWKIEGRIGSDELGYPFWSSGQIFLTAGYKSLKLGAYLPMHGGVFDINAERPLSLKPRLLNGSTGATGSFEFEWDVVKLNSDNVTYAAIGGAFAVGSLDRRRPEYLTTNLDSLYSINTMLQGYYALNYKFDDEKMLNAKVGGIYHTVALNRFEQNEILRYGTLKKNFSSYIFVEYKNSGADWFKLNATYSRLLMFGAWAEIVPAYVYAEVKYSTQFLRAAKPWEQNYYLYGTLGFNFDF